METQNKQWVCQSVSGFDHSGVSSGPGPGPGQLDPEDLSSNGSNKKNLLQTQHLQQLDNTTISNKISLASTLSSVQNKNGLEQYLTQQVEDTICENSRQIILHILDEITSLSFIEKLFLYLKLPTEISNISDPLRQPLNPLGSRTEISQTIMWIRTHLEEDPELSLPKQEVYNEYTIHCANNKMKPLSTADFGKVMKQVYPSVRPRRLGTRGNSRYCYAGLRKRFKLEVPQLPELGDRPQSSEISYTQNELTAAACTIICEWAESILGISFSSIQSLASYLVRNTPQNININSTAAALFIDFDAIHSKSEIGTTQELLPYSSHVNIKHKETQLHLQRKLQQREHKRKLQSPKVETKGKCKKNKMQASRSVSLESTDSSSPKSQGYQLNPICDKATNECALPDFSSFQVKPQTVTAAAEDVDTIIKKDSESTSLSNAHKTDSFVDEPKSNFIDKLPVPRLPLQKMKNSTPKKSCRTQKYKNIQLKHIKTDDNLDIQIAPDDSLKNADYLTRERLISVSQVDKDALDDYLHGGNNSQEQEEELMQYFKNNNNTGDESVNIPNPVESKSDKLSQLRLLLEQNLNGPPPPISEPPLNAAKNIMNMSKPNFSMSQNLVLQSCLNNSTNVKRRVSFETSVMENEQVPPSPNTRRKNFSFTPISPGPHSPKSKCSSANASPFVSPRNTPIPRTKITHTSSIPTSFVARKQPATKPEVIQEPEKLFSDLMEEKLFVNPINVMPKCNNLTMSAPPSPMLPFKKFPNTTLLQKLLDSSSKVPYMPDYDKNPISQEVSQLLSENSTPAPVQFNQIENYRSQSVPLHQMTSFKTLVSPMPNSQTQFDFNFTSANTSVAPTPVPTEFSDYESLTEINSGLNNENLNQILNILETTPTANDTIGTVFNFDTTTTGNQGNEMISVQKLIRSQSIDLDLEMKDLCTDPKYIQPSKSMPNTPLPFLKPKLELNLNNNQTEIQEDIFGCRPPVQNAGFLLNGTEATKSSETFSSALGFTMNDNKAVEGLTARRNLNLLLEQQFASNDFNTAVPRMNNGTS